MSPSLRTSSFLALVLPLSVLAAGQSTGSSNPPLDTLRRSFAISGNVLADDGTPPQGRVAIESVCSTRTRTETYTNSRGEFHFTLGGQTDVLQEASVNNSFEGFSHSRTAVDTPNASPTTIPGVQGGSMSQREAMQCFLRASVPGYRSDSITLGMLQMTGTTTVPTIVVHHMAKTDNQQLVSVTTLQAPASAKKSYERARNEIAKGQTLNAVEDLRKAIKAYPNFAEAMVQLGEIYAQQGLLEEAERLLNDSITADPKFSPAYFDLAPIAGQRRDWVRMARLTDVGLSLDSGCAPGYYFNALANYRLADYDKAEKSARQARTLDPAHSLPNVELILADIMVRRNQPQEAVEQLRTFLKFAPNSPEAPRARDMLAKLETVSRN